jgi:hypothetical protein
MGKIHNNSIFKYLLVFCLSIALLLVQEGRLHMHLTHDDHSGSSTHVIDVHPESTPHDVGLTHHHDVYSDEHSAVAVDVSTELLKNSSLQNPLVVILLFLGLFLCIPRQTRALRKNLYKTLISSHYYLFQPPPRAPPAK